MTSSKQPSDVLLAAIVQQACASGIAELSLRQIAESVGTSHRMLLYHFTSRDGLLTAVTLAVEQRELTAFLHQVQQSGIDLAAFWQRISNARLRSQERLFFELYVHALVHRDEGNFAAHAVNDWLEPIAAQLAELGVPQAHAEVHARLGLAVVRGLLLDLLATRDLVGTTKAFELYMRSTAASFLTERAS